MNRRNNAGTGYITRLMLCILSPFREWENNDLPGTIPGDAVNHVEKGARKDKILKNIQK